MDQLLTAHAAFGKGEKKPEAQRAHNSFVLRYVAGSKIKEIAKYLNISGRTVLRDIDLIFDDLMIFAFGVAGMILAPLLLVLAKQLWSFGIPQTFWNSL